MIAETISIPGHGGRYIHAFYSRPIGEGKFPGLLLIPHMPGWDEYCRETARRFSEHGYSVLCPNIYEDFGDGTPGEVTMRMRETGMVHDSSVMEDCSCALSFLHNQVNANDKVGVIGMCSGGRHTFLAACTLNGVDAAVDCWGGGVVANPEDANPARPVAPIEYAGNLNCPLIGKMTEKAFAVIAKPVGSRCNMHCKYCYYLEKRKFSTHPKQTRMSFTLLEKLIRQTIEGNLGPVVSFTWHGGEPTIAGLNFYKKVIEFEKISSS